VCVVGGINGCSEWHVSSESTEKPLRPDMVVQRFDVGEVIQGETVTHQFTFVNNHATSVCIAEKKDIQKDCGCASVAVESSRVPPGGSTLVTLRVDTSARQGKYNSAARLIWTTETGRRQDVLYRIAMTVAPALQMEPSTLAFDEKDVKQARRRAINLTTALDVDWGTLALKSSSPYFEVSNPERSAAGTRVYVKCLPLSGNRRLAARLVLSVNKKTSDSRQHEGRLQAYIPLVFEPSQANTVSVHPARPIAWTDDSGRSQGRLLLSTHTQVFACNTVLDIAGGEVDAVTSPDL